MSIEIQLPVADIKTALAGLGRVVSKSSCLPILKSIRVAKCVGGRAVLQATDLDSFVSFESKEDLAGNSLEFLLPFEPLHKAVKTLPKNDQVVLVHHDKEDVRLRYAVGGIPIEQRLDTLPVADWPQVPVIDQLGIKVDSKFQNAIREALDCCSEDTTRPTLHGAFVDVSDPKAHYVVGTDAKHLFSANSFCLDLKSSVIIPNRKFLNWPAFYEDGNWELSIQPGEKDALGWVQIKSNRWTLVTKQIEGNFPTWRQAEKQVSQVNTTVELGKLAVEFLLTVLPKLPGSDSVNKPVTFSVIDNQLILEARNNPLASWSILPVTGCQVKGPGMCITVNRDFALKALKMGLTAMDMVDPECPMVFRSEGKRLIVMPLQTEGSAVPAPLPTTNKTTPSPVPAATAPTTIVGKDESTSKTSTSRTTERNAMSKESPTTPTNAANQGSATPNREENSENNGSAIKAAINQLDKIKEALRSVIGDLTEATKALALAQKEKRATEKEIETIRESLRSLQRVKI